MNDLQSMIRRTHRSMMFVTARIDDNSEIVAHCILSHYRILVQHQRAIDSAIKQARICNS